MVYTLLLVPALIIIAGWFMYKFNNIKINIFVGYRTRNSMKSNEAWQEANKYCGAIWIRLGIAMIAFAIGIILLELLSVVKITETIAVIITMIQLVLIILPVILVENKIKKL